MYKEMSNINSPASRNTPSNTPFFPPSAPTFNPPTPTFNPPAPTFNPPTPTFNPPTFNPPAPTFTPAYTPSRASNAAPINTQSSQPQFNPTPTQNQTPAYMPAAYTPTMTQYGPPSVSSNYQGISVPPPSTQNVLPVYSHNLLSPSFTEATLMPNQTFTPMPTKPPTNSAGFPTNMIVQAEQVSKALYSYNSPIYKSLKGGFSNESLVAKMSDLYSQINK